MSFFFLTIIITLQAGAQTNRTFRNELPEDTSEGYQAFGPSSPTILAIQPLAFRGRTAADDDLIDASGGHRACTGSCTLDTTVTLPAGANITMIEMEAFDNDANGTVGLFFGKCPVGQINCDLLALAGTAPGTSPGFVTISDTLSHTVDNLNNTYVAEVIISGGTRETSLGGVRIYYRLQVSPAPGTSSFSDVPVGHWAHRYIEALVASGITTGCAPGMFCPEQAATRAEVAALVTRALGLHWPN